VVPIKNICITSLKRILRPIVRFSLSQSIKHRELVEYLKLTYIQVAKEELEKLSSPTTPSKISVMTGIQRKDVSRLLNEGPDTNTNGDVIARIIGLWENGKLYKNDFGRPEVLLLSGKNSPFSKLVSNVSTDLNPYTVAFELMRSNVAIQTAKGLKLTKPGYEPTANIGESLRLLGEDNEYLYSGVLENIFNPNEIKNIHVKTHFDNIPASMENKIRSWFLEKGGKFHEEARTFLSKYDRDLNPELSKKYLDEPAITATICTFSLVEKVKTPQ